MNEKSAEGFGRLLVERSGGIGGMLLVWEVDIDASSRRDDLGPRIADLPWSDGGQSDDAPQSTGLTVSLISSKADSGECASARPRCRRNGSSWSMMCGKSPNHRGDNPADPYAGGHDRLQP